MIFEILKQFFGSYARTYIERCGAYKPIGICVEDPSSLVWDNKGNVIFITITHSTSITLVQIYYSIDKNGSWTPPKGGAPN
jgi:hypothetical protein